MAAKKTIAVTTENLVRLGAERLTTILLELASEQPAVKRRLRLELAGDAGGERIAAEMNKRITALRSARSFVDWQKRPDFVRDLTLTRTTIADRLGQTRPDLALDLMWRFMALAEPVMNRVDDGVRGTVGAVFPAIPRCQEILAPWRREGQARSCRACRSRCSPRLPKTSSWRVRWNCPQQSSRLWKKRWGRNAQGPAYRCDARATRCEAFSIAEPPTCGWHCRASPTPKGTWTPTSHWCPASTACAPSRRPRSAGGCSTPGGPKRLSPRLVVPPRPPRRGALGDSDLEDLEGPGWEGPDAE